MKFEPIIRWMRQLNGRSNSALYAPLLKNHNSQHLAFIRHLEKEIKAEKSLFTPLRELDVTVLDLETSGFSPEEGDRILSIGAVKVSGGRILHDQTFYSLVHYDGRLSPRVQRLTGITEEQLKNAPPLLEVLMQFYRFANGKNLVAHHAGHEKKFLQHANRSLLNISFHHRIIDTVWLVKTTETNLSSIRLEDCCSKLGIDTANRHHALADAMMTAHLWRSCIMKLSENGCHHLYDVYERIGRKQERG
ncbi:exonuclease domain-containing protein [Bacillus xiapuensis]|uniref:exonuclease domain-containing protein n=1 Tax=Bacillus xiapuensis TaxID=2014075 RepID=UPI000C236C6E|nr:exonuclease domain-containing protein [Bacillus xiapuensis]